MASEYRPLTESELAQLGYTTKVGSKYVHRSEAPTRENAKTRREIENERAREIGYESYSQWQRLPNRRDEQGRHYRFFTGLMQRTRGGITNRQMHSLTNTKDDVVAFHKAYAAALKSGGKPRDLNRLFKIVKVNAPRDVKNDWWNYNTGARIPGNAGRRAA